jgi:hypothetical protein
LVSNFSTASPPANRDFRRTVLRTITVVLTDDEITTITLPLHHIDGSITAIGGSLSANLRRPDSAGRRRFALGMRIAAASPSTQITTAEAAFIRVYVADSFTGWGGQRGTAGVDRAVRCPRCGTVLRETNVIADGVTRLRVCPDCYDPPAEPPNFRWPFRT